MVINHRHPRAPWMIVVDPATGLQIEHAKAFDPDAGWVEVWCTYEAHPDHKSVWLQDGKTVEKDFMLLRMTDFEGNSTYMSRQYFRDFDVVDKLTGEVLYEGRPKPLPDFSSDGETSSEVSPPLDEPTSARSF